MGKKKINLKFAYDAPVTLSFAIIALLLFAIDALILKKPVISSFLQAPTAAGGDFPFAFSNAKAIFGLLFHILSYKEFSVLICDLIFILLLGPQVEEKYGSVIIGIMIFVAGLFSSVLNACFCKHCCSGAASVVFMLILLDALLHLSRKKVSAASIAVIILFLVRGFITKSDNGIVEVVIMAAGGLCGSLFAFLASPKARKTKDEVSLKEFDDSNSPRFKQKKTSARKQKEPDYSTEETIVGTLEL